MKHAPYFDLKKRGVYFDFTLMFIIVLVYFAWLSINTIQSASMNGRLLDAFDVDEYSHFVVIREALKEHTLYLDWSAYGHLYFNLALLPLYAMQHFTSVSDHAIILTLRLVATISSALTVIMTFGFAYRFFDRVTAWISALFLAVLPFSYNYYSVISHPDTLQMFFVVGSLYGCCSFLMLREKRWLMMSAFCAGLAFSTKYGGLFILPVIWALPLINLVGLNKEQNILKPHWVSRFLSWLQLLLINSFFFLAAFVFTSPYSLAKWQFVDGIIRESKHVAFGHIFKGSNNWFEWFEIIFSPSLLGFVCGSLLLFTLITFFQNVWTNKEKELLTPKGLLLLWVVSFMSFALLRVNYRTDRYLFIILPFLFMLSAMSIVDGLAYLKKNYSKKIYYYFSLCVVVLIGGRELINGFTRQADLITTITSREIDNPVIEAGLWMESYYPRSTRILYDKYSYIPPKFTHIRGSYGINEIDLANSNPKVVVVNKSIRDRYLYAELASAYSEGESEYLAIHNFYLLLEQQKLGFRLVKVFGNVQIFEKEE